MSNPTTPAEIMQLFADEAAEIVREELAKIGLPKKYPSGSKVRVWNSVDGFTNEFLQVIIEINDYAEWIIKGRRPLKENPGAKPPPFKAIRDWVGRRKFQFQDKRGRLLSFDRTAWAVRRIVWVKGVKGRDFATPAIDRICKLYINKLSDPLFKSVVDIIALNEPIKVIPLFTKI